MDKRFYIDSSIWRDYFEDRSDNLRPLGEFAFQFLKNCIRKHCTLIYSEHVVNELKRDYSYEQVKIVFSPFIECLVKVPIRDEHYVEARILAEKRRDTHKSDVLHALLARDNKAVLVTRDAHFDCLRDIAEICLPEEVNFG